MGAGQQQQNELTDVVLCYQAMGIPLDASPAAIERKYNSLVQEYKKKMLVADPAARQELSEGLDLLNEMYRRICNSITYKAVEKEEEKRTKAARAAIKPVHDVVAQRGLMIQCPRCNGAVIKGSEICPICKTPIYRGVEKLKKTFFTPGRLIAIALLLAVVAIAAAALTDPTLFTGKAAPAGAQKPK